MEGRDESSEAKNGMGQLGHPQKMIKMIGPECLAHLGTKKGEQKPCGLRVLHADHDHVRLHVAGGHQGQRRFLDGLG